MSRPHLSGIPTSRGPPLPDLRRRPATRITPAPTRVGRPDPMTRTGAVAVPRITRTPRPRRHLREVRPMPGQLHTPPAPAAVDNLGAMRPTRPSTAERPTLRFTSATVDPYGLTASHRIVKTLREDRATGTDRFRLERVVALLDREPPLRAPPETRRLPLPRREQVRQRQQPRPALTRPISHGATINAATDVDRMQRTPSRLGARPCGGRHCAGDGRGREDLRSRTKILRTGWHRWAATACSTSRAVGLRSSASATSFASCHASAICSGSSRSGARAVAWRAFAGGGVSGMPDSAPATMAESMSS